MSNEFIVVQAGLNNAMSATYPGGISVKLVTLKIGSGTAYSPDPATDTDIRGTLLYQGNISSYVKQADGALLITCVIPAEVGPFTFGEIGIYDDSGNLFALCCLPEAVNKTSSLNSGFGTTYTYNGLLKLGTANVVIEVPASPVGFPVQYVNQWSALEPASVSGQPLYFTIVSEVDQKGGYGLAVRRTDGTWSIAGGFVALAPFAYIQSVAGDKSWVTISMSDWAYICPNDPSFVKGLKCSFVIQAPNGYLCMAQGVASGTNIQFTFNQPFTKGNLASGQQLNLWSNYVV